MENKLRDLLDKTYELEGLIYLALQRKAFSEDFTRLIIKKSKEIEGCSSFLSLKNESDSIMESICQNNSMVNEENIPEEKDFFSIEEYVIEEENESSDSNNSLEVSLKEDSGDSYTKGDNIRGDIINNGNEENFIFKKEPKNEDDNSDSQELKKGKLVFSLNDRFRFKKELFDNSDIDFNNTLALVASMENFEEAEDYFLNEEGFDPANPVVKEFLEMIKKYFK